MEPGRQAVSGSLAAPPQPGDRALPELANVYWRPRVDARSLRRAGRLWTLCTAAHTVPFICTAVALVVLNPIATPVALAALAHAWIIPELYAARGANVVRQSGPPGPEGEREGECEGAGRVALGLLGDLVDHETRALHERTGLVAERGRLGVWLVGAAGALLVAPGGRRVYCYCVKASDPGLPTADRITHLLLALRTDEQGFATVANLAFAGARWRVRRRLGAGPRLALGVAAELASSGAAPRFARGHTVAA